MVVLALKAALVKSTSLVTSCIGFPWGLADRDRHFGSMLELYNSKKYLFTTNTGIQIATEAGMVLGKLQTQVDAFKGHCGTV